ncbi:MAG TPA: R3H domain-containing nucleic acid-binding protein [Blastocatellia bacterium]|nr:R3H domain-containing nucleic acid-binding protein [Blastocatellia bacterium]HMV83442.1 R3H domain-containing nucleic acid-binding protein [Blastocatellia bacterium]HMX24111.1 R3H domain-containing nucleic acid-binding protein [Blastocatellia bacterium]HMY70731.1 R3H domain-containing nucleic acid-binding protein [Blastocatellia bacterium]HMZ16698.1 R3H domain-containing nucleic acid-binding protein [Blastocatellia bacterium]
MTQESFEELRDKVEHFVKELVDKSSLDLRVQVTEPEPDNIEVSFQGFDLPLLLGHNAELLDALQYIARRAFAGAVASGVQIDFDANGYRNARKEELQLMAQKAAERVRTSKVPFVFDPMSAQDRRAIHTALVDIDGIRTESEGDGQMRRVKVLPA